MDMQLIKTMLMRSDLNCWQVLDSAIAIILLMGGCLEVFLGSWHCEHIPLTKSKYLYTLLPLLALMIQI